MLKLFFYKFLKYCSKRCNLKSLDVPAHYFQFRPTLPISPNDEHSQVRKFRNFTILNKIFTVFNQLNKTAATVQSLPNDDQCDLPLILMPYVM